VPPIYSALWIAIRRPHFDDLRRQEDTAEHRHPQHGRIEASVFRHGQLSVCRVSFISFALAALPTWIAALGLAAIVAAPVVATVVVLVAFLAVVAVPRSPRLRGW
jgi:hypothetical protein